MHYWYVMPVDEICSRWHTDNSPVFSAPHYCDSTENKGAYITIGPEHKLEYHQFEAVPHPNIKPMVRFEINVHFMR